MNKKIADRVQQTVKIPEHQLKEKPPFPHQMKLELTGRCDLRCVYCCVSFKSRKTGDMDPALYEKLVREAKDLGVTDLGLFWLGESMLLPRLPEYVSFAKRAGIPYVFLTTNARQATRQKFEALFAAGIDSVKFSVNAPTRDKYLELCGVDAYDAVMANIRLAHELRGSSPKPALYASTAFDPARPEEFESVDKAIGPYVDQHYPIRMYGSLTIGRPESRKLADMLPCWSLFTIPHISYDGHMTACYCDHDARYFMGDLNRMSLLEAWHSPSFVELRRNHLARKAAGTPCEHCIAYEH